MLDVQFLQRRERSRMQSGCRQRLPAAPAGQACCCWQLAALQQHVVWSPQALQAAGPGPGRQDCRRGATGARCEACSLQTAHIGDAERRPGTRIHVQNGCAGARSEDKSGGQYRPLVSCSAVQFAPSHASAAHRLVGPVSSWRAAARPVSFVTFLSDKSSSRVSRDKQAGSTEQGFGGRRRRCSMAAATAAQRTAMRRHARAASCSFQGSPSADSDYP